MKPVPSQSEPRQPVVRASAGDDKQAREKPLLWPEHFPPTGRREKFFSGLRCLGPDISFFRELRKRQAARDGALMAAWTDPLQRRIAESLGKCLQQELQWKTPWFLPADEALAVVGSPSFDTWMELDLWDLFKDLDEETGTKMGPGFWNSLVNWDDRHVRFGELVGKIAERLHARKLSQTNPVVWMGLLRAGTRSEGVSASLMPWSRSCRRPATVLSMPMAVQRWLSAVRGPQQGRR